MLVTKILGSAVEHGRAVVSNVALAKLAEARELLPMLTYEGTIENACYDEAGRTITVRGDGSKTTIALEYAPCAHPHPLAEAKMLELDRVAVAAQNGKIALIGDSLFHNWGDPESDTGLIGDISNFGVGGILYIRLKAAGGAAFCLSDLSALYRGACGNQRYVPRRRAADRVSDGC